MPGRIFISYRHQETAWPGRQLFAVLVAHFPGEQVFKDVDSIEPGEDFVERITRAVAGALADEMPSGRPRGSGACGSCRRACSAKRWGG
jgi:hypothetical protein